MKRTREGTAAPPVDDELSEDEDDEETRPLVAPEAVPERLREWSRALVRPDVGWCKVST